MYGHRVVVTGFGAITPIGLTAWGYWNNLLGGVSGVRRITGFDTSDFPVQIAAEAQGFDPQHYLEREAVQGMSRSAQLALAAGRQALDHSGLRITPANAYEVGAVVATGTFGVHEVAAGAEALAERGPDGVNPLLIPLALPNMVSCQLSIHFGIKGPVATNVGACAASVYAFLEAMHFLRRGDAQAILAGGAESGVHPLLLVSMARMGALSRRNHEPARASRPFDRDRDGFVLGEGSAVLILETLEHATRRGADIYAELAGAGVSGDAYHVSAPEPTGESASRAMQSAIRDAELSPGEIEYVCAHGTSTPLNDVTETKAIKLALGSHAYRVPISSPKSMVGHLLGGAGAISALTSVLAVSQGCVPPTANLDEPDPACDLDYVPWKPRHQAVRTAMANGFGFGGQNCAIVFKEFRS